MAKDNGYWQAVDNLAWKILNLSKTTQEPVMAQIADENPDLYEELTKDPQRAMDICRLRMSSEQKAHWNYLERIFEVIVITYKVKPDEVFGEVMTKVSEMDVNSSKLS